MWKSIQKGPKEPESLNGFSRIWLNITKKMIETSGKTLMKCLHVRLRSVGYAGVVEQFKLPKI